jgi:hypothetical protein
MDEKIEKIKKDVLDLINQNRSGLQLSRVAHTLLGSSWVKFEKVVRTRSRNELIGKMEIYRKTVAYMEMLYDKLAELEKELTEKEVEYYFPDDQEVVETIDVSGIKLTVINKIKETYQWKRANKQVIDEGNGIMVSGLKAKIST